MLLVMDVTRHGSQFTGWIRRSGDQAPVPFWGVLELLAILEQLLPANPSPTEPPAAPDPAR